MFKNLLGFVNDETGAELAEFAVAVALLVAIAVVVYEVLGDAIFNSNTATGDAIINNPGYTAPAGP